MSIWNLAQQIARVATQNQPAQNPARQAYFESYRRKFRLLSDFQQGTFDLKGLEQALKRFGISHDENPIISAGEFISLPRAAVRCTLKEDLKLLFPLLFRYPAYRKSRPLQQDYTNHRNSILRCPGRAEPRHGFRFQRPERAQTTEQKETIPCKILPLIQSADSLIFAVPELINI